MTHIPEFSYVHITDIGNSNNFILSGSMFTVKKYYVSSVEDMIKKVPKANYADYDDNFYWFEQIVQSLKEYGAA